MADEEADINAEVVRPSSSLPLRFCILVLDNSTAWTPITFGDMFALHFANPLGVGVETRVVALAGGEELPSFDSFDVLALTGSRFCIRDRDSLPWFEPLCDLVRCIARARGSGKRAIGVCFGHQLIAHALKGPGCVDKNPNPGERFVLKAETIDLHVESLQLLRSVISNSGALDELLELDASPLKVKVIVSHGDSVLTLPDGAILLASSPSCAHEMFVVGEEKNIICVQFHPEFDLDYAVKERIWKSVVEKSQRLNESEINAAQESFIDFSREASGPRVLCSFLRSFLYNRT